MRRIARSATPAARLPRLRPESDELLHLDALRFIAAVGVVLYHIWEVLGLGPVDPASRAISSLNLFVDLFFVISGFVISWVYAGKIKTVQDYGRFLHKRVARLWPLHLLLLGGFIALGAVSEMMSGGSLAPRFDCFWPHVLLLHGMGVCAAPMFNYPSWSISAEMGMYALFPVYLLVARDWRAGLLAVLLATLALTALSPPTRPWWEWTHDLGVLRAVPGFLLGVVFYWVRGTLARIPAARALVWVALALFLGAAALGLPKGPVLLPLVYVVGALGIAADLRGPTAFVRHLGPAGQLTYSVYMWHAFLLALITSSTVQGLIGNPVGNDLRTWVIGLMAVIFPISYVSLFWIEQPARRWINRLGSSRRGATGPSRTDPRDDQDNALIASSPPSTRALETPKPE